MKSSAKKIELASVDDLFSTEESRQDEQLEKIQEIPLSELHPFKDHPFCQRRFKIVRKRRGNFVGKRRRKDVKNQALP